MRSQQLCTPQCENDLLIFTERTEPTFDFVSDAQCFFRAADCDLSIPPHNQSIGDQHLEYRLVAVAKTRDQIVVGVQFRLDLASLAVPDALVEQRLGNPLQ